MTTKSIHEGLEQKVRSLEKQIARLRHSGTGVNPQLRTLLDFAPYPIVVFTMDGRVSYLNPAFTEIFGWTFHELEGKKIPYIPPGLKRLFPKTSRGSLRKKPY